MEIEEILQEHPIYKTNTLLNSIADTIYEAVGNTHGGEHIYISPINAGEELPRWFILLSGATETDHEMKKVGYKKIYVDIVYEQDFNLLNLFDEYNEVSDIISYAIQNKLKYNVRDENDDIIVSIPLNAENVKTKYDTSGLHCEFELEPRIIDIEVIKEQLIKKIGWEVNDGKE